MPKKAKTYENAIVINDIHFPYQDERALRLTLKIIKAYQPDIIFLNGDIMDFYPISKFSKSPERTLTQAEVMELSVVAAKEPSQSDIVLRSSLQREFDMAFDLLSLIRRQNKKAKIIFIDGNHEFRLEKYLFDNSAELYGLTKARLPREPVLSIPSLLRFDELDIEHISSGLKESYYRWGKMLIGHFNMVRKHSAYTARGLIEDKMMSLVQGHTHRLGSHFKTGYSRNAIVGYENGCLCELEPIYCVNPNWQHGFSVINKSKTSNKFHVQQVYILKYTAWFGDKEWTVEEKDTDQKKTEQHKKAAN
jgi:UDP-2,3-diacylglucosamine pyrophosphatase LpxH